MKILRVKKTNLYDVFMGEGWENWSRYSLVKGRYLSFVNGKELPKMLLGKIFKEIVNG